MSASLDRAANGGQFVCKEDRPCWLWRSGSGGGRDEAARRFSMNFWIPLAVY